MSEVDVAALRKELREPRLTPWAILEFASALAEIEGLRERLARQEAVGEASVTLAALLLEWRQDDTCWMFERVDEALERYATAWAALDALPLAPETSE